MLLRATDDLSKMDIDQLVLDQVPEDSENEFKREVEIEPSGRVRDSARNDVARA